MTCWQHIHIKNFMNSSSVPVVTGKKGERGKYFFLYSIKLNLSLSFSNHLFFPLESEMTLSNSSVPKITACLNMIHDQSY